MFCYFTAASFSPYPRPLAFSRRHFRRANSLPGYLSYGLLVLVSLWCVGRPGWSPRLPDTDQEMRQILGPGYAQWMRDYQQHLRELQSPHHAALTQRAGQRLIVPVVVHIIHDGEASNIADEQVVDAIRLLNVIYQARHPDLAAVIPYFTSRIGQANIEFRLAQFDPAGNCTTGITRHSSPLTHRADDQVKRLPGAYWHAARYLNVWVVDRLASGAAGYAYLPCLAVTLEGVVVRHSYFGSVGTAPDQQSRRYTLAHEVGHYLGLRHSSGYSNTTGPGLDNCADDDTILDTPNTEGSVVGTCDLYLPACPDSPDLLSNVQNIMDYSAGCRCMFTKGQVSLMQEGLVGGFACRTLLISDDNLRFTGVADGQQLPPCPPVAHLRVSGPTADQPVQFLHAGDSLTYHGYSSTRVADTSLTFQWRFAGGQPATSTSTSATPTVTYPLPGAYDVWLRVANAVGTDTLLRRRYVVVRPRPGIPDSVGQAVDSGAWDNTAPRRGLTPASGASSRDGSRRKCRRCGRRGFPASRAPRPAVSMP